MAETKVQYLGRDGLSLYDSLLKAKIANDIAESEYDDTALKQKVTANETAIAVLNGESEGSVKKQVDDAVARIVADAPEAYDTLKEISNWISSHADSAAAMNTQINTNKTDITTLKSLIGELPEGAASTTVVGYIAEIIGISKNDLMDIISTKADKALADAKEYVDNAINILATGQVSTNKTDIATLQERVTDLESVTYTPITESQINALFTEQ